MARGGRDGAREGQPRNVTVYKGDSLWSLAFAYGCSVDELLRANAGLSERTPLRPGAKLRLPRGAGDVTPDTLPWMRWDSGGKERAGEAAQDVAVPVQRGGSRVPGGRLLLALAAGVALGTLRQAPGPAGDAARAALDGTAAATAAAAKAVGPVADGAVKRAMPLWRKTLGALQFVGRASANALIVVLGGTPGRAAPTPAAAAAAAAAVEAVAESRAESARARVELAQAQALSAAAEAARLTLARELAAALAAVEALTQNESSQRAAAAAEAQRARELEQQLAAVRLAVGEPGCSMHGSANFAA